MRFKGLVESQEGLKLNLFYRLNEGRLAVESQEGLKLPDVEAHQCAYAAPYVESQEGLKPTASSPAGRLDQSSRISRRVETEESRSENLF